MLEAAVAAGVAAPRPVAVPRRGRRATRRSRWSACTARRSAGGSSATRPPGLARAAGRGARAHPRDRAARLPAARRRDRALLRGARLRRRAAPRDRVRARVGARAAAARRRSSTFCHGDFRIGNFAVDADGLVAVLDWEFAHVGDPVEDVAWPIVRAWRFGADDRRLGGVGEVGAVPRALQRADRPRGHARGARRLGGARQLKWAIGCLTQCRRHLNGAGPQRRVRGARPDRGGDGVRAARPDRAVPDRPTQRS